ncbi:MAG: methyl-accepting chemotaxis protein [Bacillota bacterium]
MNFSSLKAKLILIISILILVMVGASSFIAYRQAEGILNDSLMNAARNSADKNAKIFSEALKEPINNVDNIDTSWVEQQSGLISTLDPGAIASYFWGNQEEVFLKYAEDKEYFNTMFSMGVNGAYTATDGEETFEGSYSDKNFYKESLEKKEMIISSPFTDEDTGTEVVAISKPLLIDNEVKVLIGATVKLSYIQSLTEDMNINGYGYAWIIDENKNILTHQDSEMIGTKVDTENNSELEQITNKMVAGERDVEFYSYEGIKKEVAYAPIEGVDWSLAITADEEALMEPMQNMRRGILMAVLVTILIGIIVSYFISARIANPLVELSNVAKKVANGDLTVEIEEDNDKSEIGILRNSIREMVANLAAMIEQIKDVSEQMASSSEELSASGEQVSNTAEQVGTAIQEVASGAEEQSAQIDETRSNVTDLAQGIDNISDKSEDMDKQADNVMSNINQGKNEISNTINQVQEVKVQANKTSENINELGDLSEEIGEIVELINGISAQTNLLALNAAIEAARAGEAGRGFSVVADEIRELAEESSEATENIASLITDIQNRVEVTIGQMNKAENAVETSVGAIKSTEDSFEEINNAARKLRDLIEDVSKAANEMADNSSEVSASIEEIAAVSEEASGNAEEVAASSEEQIAATEDIVEGAEELARISDKLIETIEQFKLK